MTKVHTLNVKMNASIVDAFFSIKDDYLDQFAYYNKESNEENNKADNNTAFRAFGLGRCIAVSSIADLDFEDESSSEQSKREFATVATDSGLDAASTDPKANTTSNFAKPVNIPAHFFSFKRFNEHSSIVESADLMDCFARVSLMLPEIVLIEQNGEHFLQINSLGKINIARAQRLMLKIEKRAPLAASRCRSRIKFLLKDASNSDWNDSVSKALDKIKSGSLSKIVLSRRKHLCAETEFSAGDLMYNLLQNSTRGTIVLYKCAEVFFISVTPELLVSKRANKISSMCLAGTIKAAGSEEGTAAQEKLLLSDKKNLCEHGYVVSFIREVLYRNCHNVCIPTVPSIMRLPQMLHLCTPASATCNDGITLCDIAWHLHPTPALAGYPCGEAVKTISEIEKFNRGFFGGIAGLVLANDDGEFSVTLRSGVFDGKYGYVYAGCGIIDGSDADSEFEETELKMKTILSAFG